MDFAPLASAALSARGQLSLELRQNRVGGALQPWAEELGRQCGAGLRRLCLDLQGTELTDEDGLALARGLGSQDTPTHSGAPGGERGPLIGGVPHPGLLAGSPCSHRNCLSGL